MVGLKDQCFGVEVEMTGITREQAARELAEYFGTEARYTGGTYGTWVVKDTRRKNWKLVSDSSILAERKTVNGYKTVTDDDEGRDYWVEMVTPKLTYDQLPVLQECMRRVERAGAKVNDSSASTSMWTGPATTGRA